MMEAHKTSQKYVININHNNKNTFSNVINHGVVMNDAHLLFEVNSTIFPSLFKLFCIDF